MTSTPRVPVTSGGAGCAAAVAPAAGVHRDAGPAAAAASPSGVARALPELPLMRAEFEAGRLSYSKVRALTRVADAEAEADLLELARHATAAQLERMVRAARRRIVLADSSKVGEVHLHRFARLDDLDLVITDEDLDEDHLAELRTDDGPEVVLA